MTSSVSSPTIPKSLGVARLLAVVGLALSVALSLVHLQTHLDPGRESFCSMGKTWDCAAVAASPWAIFWGVPWSFWGLVGFLAITAAAFLRSAWLLPLSGVASLTSLVLLWISVFRIGSVCLLCEAVHVCAWGTAIGAYLNRSVLEPDLTRLRPSVAILGAPFALGLAFLWFLPSYWGAFSYKGEPPFFTGVTPEGHPFIGAELPRVTIEEYVDYGCPHCAVVSAWTLRMLQGTSDVRVVRRQQPRVSCKTDTSCLQVRMAYCAQAQGKFWRADRWLFSHNDPRKPPSLQDFARDLELSLDTLEECVNAPETRERAQREARAARKERVRNVPAHRSEGRSVPAEQLLQLFQ